MNTPDRSRAVMVEQAAFKPVIIGPGDRPSAYIPVNDVGVDYDRRRVVNIHLPNMLASYPREHQKYLARLEKARQKVRNSRVTAVLNRTPVVIPEDLPHFEATVVQYARDTRHMTGDAGPIIKTVVRFNGEVVHRSRTRVTLGPLDMAAPFLARRLEKARDKAQRVADRINAERAALFPEDHAPQDLTAPVTPDRQTNRVTQLIINTVKRFTSAYRAPDATQETTKDAS